MNELWFIDKENGNGKVSSMIETMQKKNGFSIINRHLQLPEHVEFHLQLFCNLKTVAVILLK